VTAPRKRPKPALNARIAATGVAVYAFFGLLVGMAWRPADPATSSRPAAGAPPAPAAPAVGAGLSPFPTSSPPATSSGAS